MEVPIFNRNPYFLVENMGSYFDEMPTDCSFYSEDGQEVPLHKELLYQTKFMRKMVRSLKVGYSKIEIMCPALTKNELEEIVKFLYSGKLACPDQTSASQVFQNLTQLFGFPSKNFDFNGTILKSEDSQENQDENFFDYSEFNENNENVTEDTKEHFENEETYNNDETFNNYDDEYKNNEEAFNNDENEMKNEYMDVPYTPLNEDNAIDLPKEEKFESEEVIKPVKKKKRIKKGDFYTKTCHFEVTEFKGNS